MASETPIACKTCINVTLTTNTIKNGRVKCQIHDYVKERFYELSRHICDTRSLRVRSYSLTIICFGCATIQFSMQTHFQRRLHRHGY